jgi:hypothetical protein
MFLVFIVTSILTRVLQRLIIKFLKNIYKKMKIIKFLKNIYKKMKSIKNILSVLSLIAMSDPMLLGLAAKPYLLSLNLVVKKSKNYQV